MELRAKRPKSYYKDEKSWLKAVYRNNREAISQVMDSPTFGKFNRLVNEYKKDPYVQREFGTKNPTSRQALLGLSRSTAFTSEAERMSSNALHGIKRDKEMFNEIRKHLGWKQKISLEDLQWDSKEKAYVIRKGDKVVRIKFNNSPKGGNGSLYNVYYK